MHRDEEAAAASDVVGITIAMPSNPSYYVLCLAARCMMDAFRREEMMAFCGVGGVCPLQTSERGERIFPRTSFFKSEARNESSFAIPPATGSFVSTDKAPYEKDEKLSLAIPEQRSEFIAGSRNDHDAADPHSGNPENGLSLFRNGT